MLWNSLASWISWKSLGAPPGSVDLPLRTTDFKPHQCGLGITGIARKPSRTAVSRSLTLWTNCSVARSPGDSHAHYKLEKYWSKPVTLCWLRNVITWRRFSNDQFRPHLRFWPNSSGMGIKYSVLQKHPGWPEYAARGAGHLPIWMIKPFPSLQPEFWEHMVIHWSYL